MTEEVRRCAHPGCESRVAKGRELCREHGRLGGVRPELAGPGEGLRMPTLDEELARLAAQRDRAERLLEQCMAQAGWEAREVVRCVAIMSRAWKDLATLLLRRGAQSGASELEEFLAVVAKRVRDKAAECDA